jgi:threonine dehydratase
MYRYMEGVKAIAYEIVDQLAGTPGYVFVPIGSGGIGVLVDDAFIRDLVSHPR